MASTVNPQPAFAGDMEEKQLEYWRNQLRDLPPALELPGGVTSSGAAGSEIGKHHFHLPANLIGQLRRLSAERGMTLDVTMLAAFEVLLHRYSGEADIIVATQIVTKNKAEFQERYTNTLLLRTNLSGNPMFVQLLERVRETWLAAHENKDVPFERLVSALNFQSGASGSPPVRVIFAFRNEMADEYLLAEATDSEIGCSQIKCDLHVSFTETANDFSGAIAYRKSAMSADAAERMCEQVEQLLLQIARDSESRIGELQLLTATEWQRTVVEWNQTKVEYESDQCVHEVFQSQARCAPEAVAMRYASQQLSYRELEEKSTQLARYLKKQGIGPELVVAVCVERSLEFVIGILGVLKAGGAYLPLDPEQVGERLTYMIEDSGVHVCLTQERWLQRLPKAIQPVCLDSDWKEISQESIDPMQVRMAPENLAYVMYTSGSTGRPKATSIPHRGIVRLVRNVNYARLSSEEVMLQFAPVSFDASTLEIWGSLLNGGRLEIVKAGTPSFEALGRTIAERGVTTMWLTAGLFHQMMEYQPAALRGLRQLLAGGDVLAAADVKKFLQDNPDTWLINGYGPTENTTFTSCYRMQGEFCGSSVPIGRPINNTQIYVLDRYGQPVPTGVVGELYAGGDGLARGYGKRPDLTAEKFVPHPFSETGGERLYRTGDLARYRADGVLEFVGRNDNQVKIRGFRVELGEIESALQDHKSVREAAVVVRRLEGGEKELLAYVVADGIASRDLRSFLRQRLPEYMVPVQVVSIEQMPLTPSGKLDRKALPDLMGGHEDGEREGMVPLGEVEEKLARIWQEVLQRKRMGREDNFFELGGHSLRAMQTMSRVRQVFGIEVPLRRLFQQPTIAALARSIQQELAESGKEVQKPMPIREFAVKRGSKQLPLSYAQQRLWFLYEFEADKALYNIPTALRLKGRLEEKGLGEALAEIVRRHEVLRTRVGEVEGIAVQVVEERAAAVEMRVEDLREVKEEEREEQLRGRVKEEGGREFDLRRELPLRALLLKVGEEDHVLVLTMHHIASDGWSMGVLARELGILYEAYSQGKASPLLELAMQYADYAMWQRQWLQGEIEEQQLAYWRKQLADLPPPLILPEAPPGVAGAEESEGEQYRFALSPELLKKLRRISNERGLTLYMTLLAAFQLLLYRYSGRADIVVANPIAGRRNPETEALMGFFVNTLLLRTNLGGNPTFAELLKRVRKLTLSAYENQDLPFERLVEELRPERAASGTPLVQVMFDLRKGIWGQWPVGNMEAESSEVFCGKTKFDLYLFFTETADSLEGAIEYRKRAINPEAIVLMSRNLEQLLRLVAADPETPIDDLPVFTPSERQQIVIEWDQSRRKSLPGSVCGKHESEREGMVPLGEVEEKLARIWQEVLQRKRMGREDNFFELGGHSLRAMQTMSRVRQVFGIEVPLRRLFQQPTIAALARSIQQELAESGKEVQKPMPIREFAVKRGSKQLPLSYAQQRLWFLYEFEADKALYNIPTALRLKGRLEEKGLGEALAEIVRRHEVLRTRVGEVEGIAVQVVEERAAAVEMRVEDLREVKEEEREEQLRGRVKEEGGREFDLRRELPLRALLLKVGEEDHVLVLTMHHIASDGWSMGVLARELGILYEAYSQGKASPLLELAMQYADYAMWQRQWLQGEIEEQQLAYWRKQLANMPAALDLPTVRPRPTGAGHQGALYRFRLSKDLVDGLRDVARKKRVTQFMTLLAALQLLLSRYTGETDIAVGTPIAGRTREETEGMIGFFINTLVMRTDLSGNPTFVELLKRVRETALGAYSNQDIPFEKLVDEFRISRDRNRSPFFQVLFVLLTEATANWKLGELGVQDLQAELEREKFDLSLQFRESEGELLGEISYRTELFDTAMIRRMAGHLQILLQSIVVNSEGRIEELGLLTRTEREQILVEWNATEHPYSDGHCIHQLIERQVEKTPELTALVYRDQKLTYRELNRWANQLAHYLREVGVGPGAKVAVCVDRNPKMIKALLAILKAGAAYVPLDPAYPVERLNYMLEDSGAILLLTQRHLHGMFEDMEQAPVILDLDQVDSLWKDQPDTNLREPVGTMSSSNLAYVLYTSGSTGKPKGVAIEHRNAVNFIRWARATFPTEVLENTLFCTSLNFDLSVYECFVPLAVGATVTLLRNALDCNPEMKATLINTVPSAMSALVEAGKVPNSLRVVNVAGEPLKKPLVEQIFATTNAEFVWNLYGPTETTTYSTCVAMRRGEAFAPHIGKPIWNTQVYLLDKGLQPVPVGVAGELHIGGAGVTRGYLNRPEMTAQRFVPDPYSAEPGARMYKTGDLGRWLADGNIFFLGRNDGQLKIRGYRIEVGEIESRLAEHAGIEEAVVVAREDTPGDKRLVAYYTLTEKVGGGHDESPLSADQLRGHLAAYLPEFMLPGTYVRLKSIPRTANGKVDRMALPQPEAPSNEEQLFEAPQDEVERRLAEIWGEVLKREQLSRHDDFFQMGGHSLSAMRVVARSSAVFQVHIPLHLLFDNSTVCTFGEQIRELTSGQQRQQDPPIARIPREGLLPLSFNQEGRLLVEWWAEMRSAKYAPFHFFMAFSLGPGTNVVALEAALNALASRHEILRTTFSDPKKMSFSQLPPEIKAPLERIKAGGRITAPEMREFVDRLLLGPSIFRQTIHPKVTLNLRQVDLENLSSENRDSELLRIATEAIETPFDYESAPLLRSLLFRKSSGEHLFLVVMPHLLGDGWCMEIFPRELTALHEEFAHGARAQLPELPVQSVDFAAWQRERLKGGYLEKMISYWNRQWSDFSLFDVKDLPFVKPAPETPGFIVETITHPLDRSLSNDLRHFLRQRNITLHMLWLAALNILIHLYTRNERIGIWGLFANRVRPETQNLMGWLANAHIMGVRFFPKLKIAELLEQVRDIVLAAHSQQELPMPLLWGHFMKDLSSSPGSGRAPVQPHISFVAETQTESGIDALMKEAELPYRIGRLALKLMVIDRGQDLRLLTQYSVDRFSEPDIRSLLADWQEVAKKIVENPSASVPDLVGSLPTRTWPLSSPCMMAS